MPKNGPYKSLSSALTKAAECAWERNAAQAVTFNPGDGHKPSGWGVVTYDDFARTNYEISYVVRSYEDGQEQG